MPGGIVIGSPLDPPQILDEDRQRLAFDILHRVIMDAPLAADGVDRHDVDVVEMGSGSSLVLKPLELTGIERRRERQDLQGDSPAQRDLHAS